MAENNNKKNKSSKVGYHQKNPRETGIPDPETLREQWSYAKRQYSRWYSSAWGTAILAGLSFYALGWFIKGSNPITPSSSSPTLINNNNKNNTSNKKEESNVNIDDDNISNP